MSNTKTVTTVCTMMILFIIVIAQIIVGNQYYNDCPGNRFIPIYLYGPLPAFIVLWIFWSCNVLCLSVAIFVSCCWYIAGNVVIYSSYSSNLSCNQTLYHFAFWSTNLTNFLLLVLFCSCCWKEDEERVIRDTER